MKRRLIVRVPRGRMGDLKPTLKASGSVAIEAKPEPQYVLVKLEGPRLPTVAQGDRIPTVSLHEFGAKYWPR